MNWGGGSVFETVFKIDNEGLNELNQCLGQLTERLKLGFNLSQAMFIINRQVVDDGMGDDGDDIIHQLNQFFKVFIERLADLGADRRREFVQDFVGDGL